MAANTEQLSRFVSDCVSCMEASGLSIRFGDDFREFQLLASRQPLRGQVAPVFDPAFGHVRDGNAFWVAVWDSAGELVATEALFMVDLAGDTLDRHLHQHLDWYRPPGERVDCGRSIVTLSSAATLSGKLCYNGEMWIKGGPEGYRGGPLIALVPRAAMALALSEWQPDHIWALVEPGSAVKGLVARAGFVHLEQGSVDWWDRRKSAVFAEWVAWLSAADERHLLALGPDRLCAILGNLEPAAPAAPAQTVRKLSA